MSFGFGVRGGAVLVVGVRRVGCVGGVSVGFLYYSFYWVCRVVDKSRLLIFCEGGVLVGVGFLRGYLYSKLNFCFF